MAWAGLGSHRLPLISCGRKLTANKLLYPLEELFRTVKSGVTPAFFARLTRPTGSHTNSVTPYAAASAANSCVAYTIPGGVIGSTRAALVTCFPARVS